MCGAERRWRLKQSWLGGRADNLPIEMARLPLPVLHPLDSERPFFSAATKTVGSDCAGTFTGPLCFQMVLFSCDTVDTQHLPRIRTLLLGGSTEGRWGVRRRVGRGRPGNKRGGRMEGPQGRKCWWCWTLLLLLPRVSEASLLAHTKDSLPNETCFHQLRPSLCFTPTVAPLHVAPSPQALTEVCPGR